MSKEKKTPTSYRRRIAKQLMKIVAGLVGLCLCGGMSYGLIAYVYMSRCEVRPSIDPALLPTAEYLYEHPQPTPVKTLINLRYKALSSVHSEVCYSYTYEKELYSHSWSYITLNGFVVPRYETFPYYVSKSLTRDTFYDFCIDVSKIDKGLHLIELHLKRWPWNTPIIYQGAIMVEDKSQ